MHLLLYALMFVIPILGIVTFIWHQFIRRDEVMLRMWPSGAAAGPLRPS